VKRNGNGLETDRGGERARWVTKYRASGMGLRRFAGQHGLRVGQLHYWVYGGRKPPVLAQRAPLFREVRLAEMSPTPSPWTAEVVLPDSTTVRLGRGMEVTWATALVECLRRPCSP
jgi:hypothetical protein